MKQTSFLDDVPTQTHYAAPVPRDGITFDSERDGERLDNLHNRVFDFMKSGEWRTLAEIHAACGGTEASCSARLRDFRKPKFGGHEVERKYVSDGLFCYRVIVRQASN